MGLMPWQRDRLTVVELQELWEGWLWRQKRQAWMLAASAQMMASAWAGKDAPDAQDNVGWVAFGGDDGEKP